VASLNPFNASPTNYRVEHLGAEMIGIPKDVSLCARRCGQMKNTKSKSEIDQYIGARIRECRLSLRLTQEQLASALGVSFQQVQNYEKGSNGLSAVRLFEICKILNVSLAVMFPPARPNGSPRSAPDHDSQFGHRPGVLSPGIKAGTDGSAVPRLPD
jgi:transcriptional regulator with XRE-family HTH domain